MPNAESSLKHTHSLLNIAFCSFIFTDITETQIDVGGHVTNLWSKSITKWIEIHGQTKYLQIIAVNNTMKKDKTKPESCAFPVHQWSFPCHHHDLTPLSLMIKLDNYADKKVPNDSTQTNKHSEINIFTNSNSGDCVIYDDLLIFIVMYWKGFIILKQNNGIILQLKLANQFK